MYSTNNRGQKNYHIVYAGNSPRDGAHIVSAASAFGLGACVLESFEHLQTYLQQGGAQFYLLGGLLPSGRVGEGMGVPLRQEVIAMIQESDSNAGIGIYSIDAGARELAEQTHVAFFDKQKHTMHTLAGKIAHFLREREKRRA